MKFSIEGTSGAAVNSVTRLSNLLDFGQLFKAFGQQLICPNLPHSNEIFVKVSKSIIFQVNSFLGNFYRHLAIFSGHTGSQPTNTHTWAPYKKCVTVFCIDLILSIQLFSPSLVLAKCPYRNGIS